MKFKLNGNGVFEVSSPFGAIDNMHVTPHTGIDLVMKSGTELFSPVDGVVERIVDYGSENIGKGIIIKSDSGENVILGHLSDIKTSVGQHINQGDFVALSGNTGYSSGSHLHLGMRSENGSFINPEKLLQKDGVISWDKLKENGKVNNFQPDNGIADNGVWGFIQEWRKEGFWEAMYGEPFFQVCQDFFKELFHDIGLFILGNGDIFFLAPAIFIMFATFFIGRNKYTKYIVPLWFVYFVTSIFHKMLL
jgi:hypothetical protein